MEQPQSEVMTSMMEKIDISTPLAELFEECLSYISVSSFMEV